MSDKLLSYWQCEWAMSLAIRIIQSQIVAVSLCSYMNQVVPFPSWNYVLDYWDKA